MELGQLKFRLNDEEVVFNVYESMRRLDDLKVVFVIESIDEVQSEVPIEKRLGVKTLEVILMNFESDGIPNYDEMVKVIGAHGYHRHNLKLELDLKNHESQPTRLSIEKPPILE